MAGAIIPDDELTFFRVKGHETGSMGSFGSTWNNISRVGLDEQRFIRTGLRGSVETVEMFALFVEEADAKEFERIARAKQGKETLIKEILSELQWQVFIQDVKSGIRAVEASGKGVTGAKFMVNCIITFQLVN